MSLIWAAQVAAVTRWKADGAVNLLVADRIYDGQAPEGAARPYVVVGESTEAPVRAMGAEGGSATLSARVVSDYEGTKEGLEVAAALKAALATPLTLAGYGAARLKQEFVETLTEERTGDTPLRLIPIRYRIVSLEA